MDTNTLIIPAIDLKDGQCVRLRQGEMEGATVFSDDPAAMAKHWLAQGARRLHLVDLNGAFAGKPKNEAAVRSIIEAVGTDIPVQLGGGIRDLETIGLAVTAAETGILVLATLHTSGASATVDRMVSVFPAAEQALIRSMLSTSLCGVVSQQLVRRVDGKGMLAAVEVLVNNAAVANILREGKTDLLASVIQSGALVGMQTMDSSLRRLLDAKLISGSEAYRKASNKAAFEQFRERDEEPA